MVDPLTGSCLQIRLQPTVAVTEVLQYDLAAKFLECFLIRIVDAIPLPETMLGVPWTRQGLHNTVSGHTPQGGSYLAPLRILSWPLDE